MTIENTTGLRPSTIPIALGRARVHEPMAIVDRSGPHAS